jgi:hypothetical protein
LIGFACLQGVDMAVTSSANPNAVPSLSATGVYVFSQVSGDAQASAGGQFTVKSINGAALTPHGVMIGEGVGTPPNAVVLGSAQILVGQTAADPQAATVSGDATLSSAGALTVTKTNGTAFSGLATAAPTAHGVLIGEGSAAPNAVTLSDAQILIGQTSGDPQAKTVAGDATFADTGALTVTKTNGVAFGAAATAAAGQLPATATNDNAGTGKLGEYVSASVSSGSPINLTSLANSNLTSISLTPGDWDVVCDAVFAGTATSITYLAAGISTTSATFNFSGGFYSLHAGFGGSILGDGPTEKAGPIRISISATTTVYGVVAAQFSGGTATAYGLLQARRVR